MSVAEAPGIILPPLPQNLILLCEADGGASGRLAPSGPTGRCEPQGMAGCGPRLGCQIGFARRRQPIPRGAEQERHRTLVSPGAHGNVDRAAIKLLSRGT